MTSPAIQKLQDPTALLKYCGINGAGLFKAPFREDNNPSFSVFKGRDEKFIWQDKASGVGGDLLHLVMLVNNCDQKEAFRFLAKWNGSPQVTLVVPKTGRGNQVRPQKIDVAATISSIKPAGYSKSEMPRHYSESRYLKQYQLFMPEWVAQDLEAYTSGPYSNLQFKSVAGSVHIRNVDHFAAWENGGAQTFSVCGNSLSPDIIITEGIGDFLALLEMFPAFWRNSVAPNACNIILNSTDNSPKSIKWIQNREIKPFRIMAGLDYGFGGDRATEALISAFPGIVNDIRSSLIPKNIDGVKDLRDAYDISRGFR